MIHADSTYSRVKLVLICVQVKLIPKPIRNFRNVLRGALRQVLYTANRIRVMLGESLTLTPIINQFNDYGLFFLLYISHSIFATSCNLLFCYIIVNYMLSFILN